MPLRRLLATLEMKLAGTALSPHARNSMIGMTPCTALVVLLWFDPNVL